MKRTLAVIAIPAVAVWIAAMPAAAQGHGSGHGAGAAGGSMNGAHDHDTGNSGNSASSSSSASGPRTPGELLMGNKNLATKLSGLLPAGTDLQQATAGFKNLGQFVAAVHVSHNLGISFASLKCTELATAQACPGMTVPSKGSSLGHAIHALKPDMSSTETKSAAKQAKKEASSDVNASGS